MAASIGLAWLLMQSVHEFGHVIHAWLSGGTVRNVVLYPTELSRTDVSPNPRPNFVTWGGPLWGVVIPLALAGILKHLGSPYSFLTQFFAGFCLVSNGAYLAAGALARVGDADDLLRHGTPMVLPVAAGVMAVAAGLFLWDGLGSHFGIGPSAEHVSPRMAGWIAVTLVVLICLELVIGGR